MQAETRHQQRLIFLTACRNASLPYVLTLATNLSASSA